MKKLFAAFFLSIVSFSVAQVKWMTMDQALKAQEVLPKKIMIDFYADWCGPCKIMEKKTYGHPVISAYINENYYPVKFNAEGNEKVNIYGRNFVNSEYSSKKGKNAMHEFTRFMNVNAIPTTVFLDAEANPITLLQGALTAKEIEPYLTFFATDEHLKIKTRQEWEGYQKKFRSQIKD